MFYKYKEKNNLKPINVLSLFDGISCGQIALERAGIPVTNYFASEIDKHAIKVTQHNYPNTIQLGDVTKWKEWDLPKIDLLIGGSPCQGFSRSGKMLNFSDPRSVLFFEYINILKYLKNKNPKLKFLLENVRMKKEWENLISENLQVSPRIINSSLVSAQKRDRLYWANWDFDSPENKNILLRDILEDDAIPETEKAYCLTTSGREGLTSKGIIHSRERKKDNFVYYPSSDIGEDVKTFFFERKYYRKLTPIESERLQTLSDNYTSSISDAQRNRVLGNCWTVDVIKHIFERINE